MINPISISNSPQVNYATKKSIMEDDDTQDLSTCLVKIGNERDKVAFATLFKWFAPKIMRFGIKTFNNEASAKELLQETMTKVWKKAHTYDETKGKASTWVYTVMRNVSFDMLRKIQSNREDTISDDIWPMLDSDENSSEDAYPDHLMSRTMSDHVDQLPDNQQQVIKGVYFNELSQEQLAKQLDIPVGTVKSRLRLALAKLKQYIGEDS
jgi:RNA polymerase sigma-70 factor (ECF subfamily)